MATKQVFCCDSCGVEKDGGTPNGDLMIPSAAPPLGWLRLEISMMSKPSKPDNDKMKRAMTAILPPELRQELGKRMDSAAAILAEDVPEYPVFRRDTADLCDACGPKLLAHLVVLKITPKAQTPIGIGV